MKTGQVITFYSYKGGVGRTMALANIGTMLSHWGYRVLMVDWDLEAPGLENYFKDSISVEEIKKRKGLVDLLHPNEEDKKLTWGKIAVTIKTEISKTPIHLITAGRRDENYYDKVRDFDINVFYEEEDGYNTIEELRNQWKASYDFVLIDSRTGITDIGGICTIQMPDVLVTLFTPTKLGFEGIVDVAERALVAQQKLFHARYRLTILPIPTRMDSNEFGLMRDWMNRFANDLKDIYKEWLPVSVTSRNILDVTKVPYFPYFSYGEKLPIIEQGTTDPTGLGYAYESIAALIANQFIDVDLLINDRGLFLQKVNLTKEEIESKQKQSSLSYLTNKVKKIYLSYANSELKLARKLYEDLVMKDYNIWYRQLIVGEKNIAQTVMWKFNEADVAIVLTSMNYDLMLGITKVENILVEKANYIGVEIIKVNTSARIRGRFSSRFTVDIFSDTEYESGLKHIIQAIESA